MWSLQYTVYLQRKANRALYYNYLFLREVQDGMHLKHANEVCVCLLHALVPVGNYCIQYKVISICTCATNEISRMCIYMYSCTCPLLHTDKTTVQHWLWDIHHHLLCNPGVKLTILMTLNSYDCLAKKKKGEKKVISPANIRSYIFSASWHECHWMLSMSQTLSEKVTVPSTLFTRGLRLPSSPLSTSSLSGVALIKVKYSCGKVYFFPISLMTRRKLEVCWPLKLLLNGN